MSVNLLHGFTEQYAHIAYLFRQFNKLEPSIPD